MSFYLKFSSRALREIGEDRAWYEMQNHGLGEEFIAAIELPETSTPALCRSHPQSASRTPFSLSLWFVLCRAP